MDKTKLEKLTKLVRYYILKSSTEAGSGHPTSSLSAADIMTTLLFGGTESGSFFHFDFKDPLNINNDRFLFSKGHATPLYYSLFLAANQITEEEIMKVRKFDSPLEGHPTPRFKFTEAATGSLGQGLSVGVGLALGIKKSGDNNTARVNILIGDGEVAEGSIWEAANTASYYKLDNLTAIIDVNRLGQSQETSMGWDTDAYRDRLIAFGWEAEVIDGHDLDLLTNAFKQASLQKGRGKPFAIIARTVKGKGVSFIENKDGWHGKPLKKEELEKALAELGDVDTKIRGEIKPPEKRVPAVAKAMAGESNPETGEGRILKNCDYKAGDDVATRKAYGNALKRIGADFKNLVVLDGDVKNSTYAEIFKESFPDRFFEMFIAEQNMAGVAGGFARLGYIPFASSFACFLTRAFDQIRMASISGANIKFCGSHAGVSIGEDGPSQMALEDLAMFRAVGNSTVFYPSDAVSTEKLVEIAAHEIGIFYLRTSRPGTPVIYANGEEFRTGGSKIHRIKNPEAGNKNKKVVIIGAGVTLFEALKAQEWLVKDGIEAVVVDLYSIKPVDAQTLKKLAEETQNFITVEDHYPEGGIGDAVLNVFADDAKVKIHKLAVYKTPRSGKPAELLAYEQIDVKAIVEKTIEILKLQS